MISTDVIYLLPIIASFIGYLTNWVAVKMLFHPRKEINLYLFKIQGVFPKRQGALAESLGEVVSRELINIVEIKASLSEGDFEKEIYAFFEQKIDEWVRDKLVENFPMIKMFLSEELMQKVKNMLLEEFKKSLPFMLDAFLDTFEKKVDVKAIVANRVKEFSSDKLELILIEILKKEFRTIEIIGGVLGFAIGLIQVLLIKLPAYL